MKVVIWYLASMVLDSWQYQLSMKLGLGFLSIPGFYNTRGPSRLIDAMSLNISFCTCVFLSHFQDSDHKTLHKISPSWIRTHDRQLVYQVYDHSSSSSWCCHDIPLISWDTMPIPRQCRGQFECLLFKHVSNAVTTRPIVLILGRPAIIVATFSGYHCS